MKKILPILITSFLIGITKFEIKAQQWCRPGATWEYENLFVIKYLYKFVYSGDTIIDGNNVNIISKFSRNYYYGPIGSNPYAGPSQFSMRYYTLYRNDSLFNYVNGQFRFLIDFNAEVGDTWEIELFNPYNDTFCATEIRTVDSVGIEQINGINMRWVAYSSNNIYSNAKAYERFGPINNYIFPHLFNCIDVIQEVELNILRCYSDDEIGEIISESTLYTSPDIPCELYETVSINEVNFKNEVRIFPNPTKEKITIQIGNLSNVNCIINDYLGMEVHNTKLTGSQSEIMLNISPGLYFIKLYDPNNELISTQKIVVIN